MKKRSINKFVKTLVLAIVLIFVLSACKSKEEVKENPAPTQEEQTATPEVTPEPETTPEVTPETSPEVTPETTPEVTPEDDNGDDEFDYSNYIGTWYLVSGEIDGDEWYAIDEGISTSVTFNEISPDDELTATYTSGYAFEEQNVRENIPVTAVKLLDGTWLLEADIYELDDVDDSFFELSDEGYLIEYYTVYYDSHTTSAGGVRYYGREPVDFAGSIWDTTPKIVPEQLAVLLSDAQPNQHVAIFTNPSDEIWDACIEAGWTVSDETDNEWIIPMERPTRTIIVNTTDKPVSFEIHEPAESYDPSTSDSYWEPGPFMYCTELEGSDIWLVMADVAETPSEARHALYMEFDDGSVYYFRLYDLDYPFISF